ncbi:MAG: nitrate reductase subunit alpha [Burkholderiaceae bacterium]
MGYLESFSFFQRTTDTYSNDWGAVTNGDRSWEVGYRGRWAHDKIVRSTHGVNCTGSCSWKVYVKGGIVTWETQQTDYPRTPADMPNHEPRGCPRGASFSWYLYSANRIKHPMGRARLLALWREARKTLAPLEAWKAIVDDPVKSRSVKEARGLGGLVRSSWDEAIEITAAAHLQTARQWGPDRVVGFSPIPAYSLVSYGAGTRYLSLFGGTILSFYDWYCDLPPASPQTWGEQTDVPESLAWYRSGYVIVWGTNISMTRTPDAHFLIEARYNGTKVVAVMPDYVEVTKNADWWVHPKQGTDAALALAMGHVVMKEFLLDQPEPYFVDYLRRLTDMPILVRLDRHGDHYQPGRTLRGSDFADQLASPSNAEWKTVAFDEASGRWVAPQGSIGFRWNQEAGQDAAKWNLDQKDGGSGAEVTLALSMLEHRDGEVSLALPYFGGIAHEHFPANDQGTQVLLRKVPVKKLLLPEGEVLVTTVFDLTAANYGLARGLADENAATGFDDNKPYTPAWQERITGVPAADAIRLAREFASNAAATRGRSSVLMGAGVNQWFHTDNTYRAVINLLMMCGTVGVVGGGWCHYVGQEKIRPTAGWANFSFALDWSRPPRQMNATSFFYAHTNQWRYEKMAVSELLSPLADRARYGGSFIDFNVRSERMGWLPSAPQLNTNPFQLCRDATAAGMDPKDYAVRGLKNGSLQFAVEDIDAPESFPRCLIIWRANLLGSSGKGHEYFLKHLLGTQSGILGAELGAEDPRPLEVRWREIAPEGKLDLLTTLDFRMSTTALYSDIVLPAATFYEKNDLNTTDMHSFIHPFVKAVDPAWDAKSDFDIFLRLSAKVSELARDLPVEQDLVLTPLGHDSPHELGQALGVADWKRGEVDLIPGKTAPAMTVVERDYANLHRKFTSIGPLLEKLGITSKGLHWTVTAELTELAADNGVVTEAGVSHGLPRISTDIDAANMILALSPETHGAVSVRSWETFQQLSGKDGSYLSRPRSGERIRFTDLEAQPRKVMTGADWSGIESEAEPYAAFWTNVNLLLPWRTLTGRQHFYQDHEWMRAFGQALVTYKAPIDPRATLGVESLKPNGNPAVTLNFLTTHQKWGIHSTFYDNERMLTLSRGGPAIWIAEDDAARAGIVDNDWIEAWNVNGALVARAIVSQRLPAGMCIMSHATEKTINTPGSEISGTRGGIHNSATRVVINPTHMIGGYAQQSYGFNYYGTIGANRDEFVLLRKMAKVDWMDAPAREGAL